MEKSWVSLRYLLKYGRSDSLSLTVNPCMTENIFVLNRTWVQNIFIKTLKTDTHTLNAVCVYVGVLK